LSCLFPFFQCVLLESVKASLHPFSIQANLLRIPGRWKV
jgi:hypothetical protein